MTSDTPLLKSQLSAFEYFVKVGEYHWFCYIIICWNVIPSTCLTIFAGQLKKKIDEYKKFIFAPKMAVLGQFAIMFIFQNCIIGEVNDSLVNIINANLMNSEHNYPNGLAVPHLAQR